MKKGSSRTYEYELSREYPYSEADMMSLRSVVDGYLKSWGIPTSNKNRKRVLKGALEKALHINVTADKLFRDLPEGK